MFTTYGIRMIKIYKEKISKQEMKGFLGNPFSDMIKFVVDIKKEIVAMGGELHSDAEALLLENGSAQGDLWGGNFYPANPQENQIEYSSLINIRPSAGNRSMEVKDETVKAKMREVVQRLLL